MVNTARNEVRQENSIISAAEARITGVASGGGSAVEAFSSGLATEVTPDGVTVDNPGGFNGSLSPDDPDYDPILNLMPTAYERYWRIGDVVGSAPIARA